MRQVSENGRLQPAHIVFVADSERHRIGQLVRAAPAHALIVTETPDALSQGSVINFVIVDGRVLRHLAHGCGTPRAAAQLASAGGCPYGASRRALMLRRLALFVTLPRAGAGLDGGGLTVADPSAASMPREPESRRQAAGISGPT